MELCQGTAPAAAAAGCNAAAMSASGCYPLIDLHPGPLEVTVDNAEDLQHIPASTTALILLELDDLQQLPESLNCLQQLQLLYIHSCNALTSLPAQLPAALQQLHVLALHECSSLTSLPDTLGAALALQELSFT